MKKTIPILLVCLVAATALAWDDAGPSDAYTDGTTIYEDFHTGLICEDWQDSPLNSYAAQWGVDGGGGTPPPQAMTKFTTDGETRRCGIVRWHTDPHGQRTHHNLSLVKVTIHQERARILSVKICAAHYNGGTNAFTRYCTDGKTSDTAGDPSTITFDYPDLLNLRSGIPSSSTITFLEVDAYYDCDPDEVQETCSELDMPALHGAYFRWQTAD